MLCPLHGKHSQIPVFFFPSFFAFIMPASHHPTRARPSLSCALCRRRKVRCTKEQPACDSCVRTNEVCEYDSQAWRASQAKASQKQNASKQRSSSQASGFRDAIPQDRDWVALIGHSLAPPQSHSTMGGASTVRESSSERFFDRSTRASPTESGDSTSLQANGNFSDVFTSNSSEPFPQLGRSGRYDGLSSTTPWTTLTPEDFTGNLNPQRHTQLLSPGITVSDSQSFSQSNQPATSTNSLSQEVQAFQHNSQLKSMNPVRHPGRPDSTSDKQTPPNNSTQITPHPGYLSIRSGARVRYVGSAFWAYIRGTVRSTSYI